MPVFLNLLEEEQRKEAERQKDPVKLATIAGGGLVVFVLSLSLVLAGLASSRTTRRAQLQSEWDALKANVGEETAGTAESAFKELVKMHEQRFLWAPQVGWLKNVIPSNVQLTRVTGRRETETLTPMATTTEEETRKRPPSPKTVTHTILTLDGVLYGPRAQIEMYEFRDRLQSEMGKNPMLQSVQLLSVTPGSPQQPRESPSVRFIIECRYREAA